MKNIVLLTALLVVLGAVPVLAQDVRPAPPPMPAPGTIMPVGTSMTPAPPGEAMGAPGSNFTGALAPLTR